MSDDEFAALDREGEALELHFEKELLEQSFYSFVKAAWHLVEPAQPFVPTWHVERVCAKLEKCYSGEIKRAIFNVPPGTANTTAAAPPPPPEQKKGGLGGMLGGLKKMAEANQNNTGNSKPQRSVFLTTSVEMLKLTRDVTADAVAIPAGFKETK